MFSNLSVYIIHFRWYHQCSYYSLNRINIDTIRYSNNSPLKGFSGLSVSVRLIDQVRNTIKGPLIKNQQTKNHGQIIFVIRLCCCCCCRLCSPICRKSKMIMGFIVMMRQHYKISKRLFLSCIWLCALFHSRFGRFISIALLVVAHFFLLYFFFLHQYNLIQSILFTLKTNKSVFSVCFNEFSFRLFVILQAFGPRSFVPLYRFVSAF